MNTRFLRPAEGRVVIREDGNGAVPETGEDVPLTTYYRRRLKDGDLVPASRPRPPRPKAPKTGGEGDK